MNTGLDSVHLEGYSVFAFSQTCFRKDITISPPAKGGRDFCISDLGEVSLYHRTAEKKERVCTLAQLLRHVHLLPVAGYGLIGESIPLPM